MAASEFAVAAVQEAVRPGASEQELFALMYGEVIRQGGEFIETRLLTSGPRAPTPGSTNQAAGAYAPASWSRSIPM
jgi:Xaa-Pro aminopeptidase